LEITLASLRLACDTHAVRTLADSEFLDRKLEIIADQFVDAGAANRWVATVLLNMPRCVEALADERQ